MNFKTHVSGNTIDLVITKGIKLTSISQNDPGLSDHFSVDFSLNINKNSHVKKEIAYRDVKNIDLDSLKDDIKQIDFKQSENVTELAQSYQENLENIFNKHAPIVEKTVILRPNTKWYTKLIREQKVIRRRKERKWRKSRLENDFNDFRKQCDFVNLLLNEGKSEFYSNQIIENSNDKRRLFQITKKILNANPDTRLPDVSNVADSFCNYFVDKIVRIRSDIKSSSDSLADLDIIKNEIFKINGVSLDYFSPTTTEEVRKVINSMSTATCELDPIPTNILKSCCDELLPVITDIVNLSLKSGQVPSDLKRAIIKPLLKKNNLDHNDMKNFRPVANLGFLSKIIEKIVASRLTEYLDKNDLHNITQSAYRRYHSTETAILRVHNDLVCAIDRKRMTVLILLDLSAAFDTIDHDILLRRLKNRFGIQGVPLEWFRSYLCRRSQRVQTGGGLSNEQFLDFSVPQGSILGPILFSLYTAPLGDIARKHSMDNMFYADDTQLYVTLDNSLSTTNIEKCVDEIRSWMAKNMLKLNDAKTEILLVGSPNQIRKFPKINVRVGSHTVTSETGLRNLGAYFDQTMSMSLFISEKCKSLSYQLRGIAKIRKYLTNKTAQSLVNALFTSRLDYCNSILFGATKLELDRLQKLQNMAARIICRVKKYEHITPSLYQLHWLPVEKRIVFKILVITFKVLDNSSPKYLSNILVKYEPSRVLRSQNSNFLTEYKIKSKYTKRAFSRCAPILWNNLPSDIRNVQSLNVFKKKLKTLLFMQAYSI